ncbi:MAG: hypothetical protein ACLQGT_06740 [Terracidiphilus sp.]
MQLSRGWRLIVYVICFFAFLLTASIVLNPKLLHDLKFFSRGIPFLFCGLVTGALIIWFGEGRKYYKIAVASLQVIGFGGLAIYHWIKGDHVFTAIPAFICILGLVVLFDEIKKQTSLAKSHKNGYEDAETE